MQAVIFTFLEFEFPLKNLSLVRLVSTKFSKILKKIEKNVEDMRALCPW
jgi:hypothetical protein